MPISIAAGFYLNDYVRHDLSFGYQKVNFKQSVVGCQWYDRAGNIIDRNGKFVVNLMTDGSSSNALTLTKTALTVEELVETSDLG